MSTGLPSLASRNAEVNGFGSPSASAGSTVTSAPSRSARSRLSGVDAVAMTRPAPHRLASGTASAPTPPAPPPVGRGHHRPTPPPRPGDDDHALALGEVRARTQQVPRGGALQHDG